MARRVRDQHADRVALLRRIKDFGSIMPRPCNRCRTSNRECIVSKDSKRCHHCVAQGKSCSFITSDLDWDKLVSASNRLEREEEELNERMAAMFARLNRIKKQRRLLQSRAGKFLQSDLRTVEELESQEEREEESRRQLENDQRLVSLEMDQLFDVTFGSLGPDVLPSLDSPGDNPLSSAEHSANAS